MCEQVFFIKNTAGAVEKLEDEETCMMILPVGSLRLFTDNRYALSTLHDAFQCCFLLLLFLPFFAFDRSWYAIGLIRGLLRVFVDAALQLYVHLPLPLLLFPPLGSLFLRSKL